MAPRPLTDLMSFWIGPWQGRSDEAAPNSGAVLIKSRVVCAGIVATSEIKSPRRDGPAGRTGSAESPVSKTPSARAPGTRDHLPGARPGLIRGKGEPFLRRTPSRRIYR